MVAQQIRLNTDKPSYFYTYSYSYSHPATSIYIPLCFHIVWMLILMPTQRDFHWQTELKQKQLQKQQQQQILEQEHKCESTHTYSP